MSKQWYFAVDAGHGGNDPGACANGLKEKDMTLTTALACRDYLKAHSNIKVLMSRTVDKNNSLNGFCAKMNQEKVDAGIAIHYNAGGGEGSEFWIAKGSSKGQKLAELCSEELHKLGQISHGAPIKTKLNAVGKDYFGFNRMPVMPSIICEGGFIDNKKDVKKIDTKAEQKKIGYAYAKALMRWAGLTPKGYITLQSMNIRKEPNSKSEKIGHLEKNVIISGTPTGNWLKIDKGYVCIKNESKTKTYLKKL